MDMKVAIVGGGNLGTAIAEGLLYGHQLEAASIYLTRRKTHLLENFTKRGVNVTSNNEEAVNACDLVLLAIKPYQVEAVLREVAPVLTSSKVVVSMVAGVSLETLSKAAGEHIPLFRAMPNTAIALCESMSCIAYSKQWESQKDVVVNFFEKLGSAIVVNEELMSAATVLGSCGVAFALRFMRAAMQGGIEIGFSAEMAQHIVAQTMKGASELILKSGHHPEKEIDKVTTPMGVTISGLNEMEHQGFSSSLIQGLVASYRKIERAK